LTLASSGTAYSVIVSNGAGAVPSSSAVVTVIPAAISSVNFTNLHLFTGAATDGNAPAGSLMQGMDGNLYGTASGGGTSFGGTIFRMSLSGVLTNLASFGINGYVGLGTVGESTTNGAYPQGALVQVHSTGLLYGVTEAGGNNDDGVFFRVATNGTTIPALTQFTGAGDSEGADCTLCLASDGNFYGTSTEGGANSKGSVYKLATNGTVTLLYSFTGASDGSDAIAGLVQGPDGYLYGVNVEGGTYGDGTAFKISTSGTLIPLVQFNRAVNGAEPFGGLVFGQDGNLYGTTAQGGANDYGTVFVMTTNGSLTTLFSFSGTNGGFPGATLVQAPDGSFYGTTEGNETTSGGGIGGQGTVFRITTNGVLTTVVWFDGYNGGQPEGGLVLANNGKLYGTTTTGGTGYNPTTFAGWGTVYEITLPVLVPTNGFVASNAVAPLPYTGTLAGQPTPPAGDTFTYSLVSGPAWLSVSPGGALSGTPAITNVGTNLFVIDVADANGYSASGNLSIVVIADPAPTFVTNPIVESNAIAGDAYSGSIATNATAPYLSDGDVITFALVSGPAWLTVATNGVLSGTPSNTDAGTNTFIVSATDLGGSSNVANLIIDVTVSTPPAPVIVSQPASTTNYAGTTASFTVGATGAAPLSYAWYFGTNLLAGQTNSTLTLSSVGPSNVGSYQVTVTNLGGSTNSIPATLTVLYQPATLLPSQLAYGPTGFQLVFSGPPGQTYEILASSNLLAAMSNWTIIGTGTFTSNNVVFIDTNAVNNTVQYYDIESP
jgi:uncharacterized repeat protein (TIGR03803 family)